jgi:transcriptional regulator with GAF, ATPase, and Fis domain
LRFELAASAPAESTGVKTDQAQASQLLTRDDLKRHERESIVAALKQTGGKVFGAEGAAELLGMKPTTLASRLKALGIERKPSN